MRRPPRGNATSESSNTAAPSAAYLALGSMSGLPGNQTSANGASEPVSPILCNSALPRAMPSAAGENTRTWPASIADSDAGYISCMGLISGRLWCGNSVCSSWILCAYLLILLVAGRVDGSVSVFDMHTGSAIVRPSTPSRATHSPVVLRRRTSKAYTQTLLCWLLALESGARLNAYRHTNLRRECSVVATSSRGAVTQLSLDGTIQKQFSISQSPEAAQCMTQSCVEMPGRAAW